MLSEWRNRNRLLRARGRWPWPARGGEHRLITIFVSVREGKLLTASAMRSWMFYLRGLLPLLAVIQQKHLGRTFRGARTRFYCSTPPQYAERTVAGLPCFSRYRVATETDTLHFRQDTSYRSEIKRPLKKAAGTGPPQPRARNDAMATPPKAPPRPLCPHCLAGYGDPRVVTMKGRDRTVTYVCERCLHEWDVVDEPKTYKP